MPKYKPKRSSLDSARRREMQMPSSLCTFPVAGLRAYRDALLSDVRELVAAELHADVRVQMQSLYWIERLAADHEDIAGCRCWHTEAAE